MKRLILLLIMLLAATGCSAGAGNLPDRAQMLPDSFIKSLAGAPMRLLHDQCDAGSGYAQWAWEETEGTPRLLFVEVWVSPSAFDKLYGQAMAGAEVMSVPEGAEAREDGRAIFLKTGGLCFRIVAMGFTEEQDVLGMLISKISYESSPEQ
jgi:hypothetical protein